MTGSRRPPVYTVSMVNRHISSLFRMDQTLNTVYVKGELSNVKYSDKGHIYFTLKDEKSQLRCALWASSRKNLNFELKNGDSVIAFGQISVYERDGTYQLYATHMRREGGVGALYEQFEALRKKLLEMGMFDPQYKRPIPPYARTIGVVTARTGAVIHDIETVSKRRDPGIRILLCPCAVQGEGAADEICRALEMLDKAGTDVIIVGRGGGSMEDLWAFNEEKVAWAIFNCKTPVISAVGHETDTTIADLVADRRAATPSEAAEIAVSDMGRLMLDIRERQTKLTRLMRQKLEFQAQRAKYYGSKLQAVSPLNQLRSDRQVLSRMQERLRRRMEDIVREDRMYLETLDQRMQAAFRERNKEVRHRHALLAERLRALSPQAKLDAGYAYVETAGRKPVRSVNDLDTGSRIRIRLRDGAALAAVEELETDEQS